MILMQVNGIEYTGFTQVRVSKSIEQASGQFSFVATSGVLSSFPIKRQSSVKIFADDDLVISGYVDIISVSYNNSNHSINIQGRDKTSLIIDSSLTKNIRSFNAPITLEQLASNIISGLGYSINITNNVTGLPAFKNPIVGEIGQSAFSLIEKYARKQNVLVTTDADGDLVFTRAGDDTISTILLKEQNNFETNILEGEIVFDDSKRYNEYICYGQQVPAQNISNKNQVTQIGRATDNGEKLGKKMVFQGEQEITTSIAITRADWEANNRRAKSSKYRYKVQGFKHADGLWEINKKVRVVDDFADIDATLLIRSVEFDYSESGSFTTLELLPQDAFTLNPSETLVNQRLNDQGEAFQ